MSLRCEEFFKKNGFHNGVYQIIKNPQWHIKFFTKNRKILCYYNYFFWSYRELVLETLFEKNNFVLLQLFFWSYRELVLETLFEMPCLSSILSNCFGLPVVIIFNRFCFRGKIFFLLESFSAIELAGSRKVTS